MEPSHQNKEFKAHEKRTIAQAFKKEEPATLFPPAQLCLSQVPGVWRGTEVAASPSLHTWTASSHLAVLLILAAEAP